MLFSQASNEETFVLLQRLRASQSRASRRSNRRGSRCAGLRGAGWNGVVAISWTSAATTTTPAKIRYESKVVVNFRVETNNEIKLPGLELCIQNVDLSKYGLERYALASARKTRHTGGQKILGRGWPMPKRWQHYRKDSYLPPVARLFLTLLSTKGKSLFFDQ
jgi:hypothetical protein